VTAKSPVCENVLGVDRVCGSTRPWAAAVPQFT
jgi:hypothetical protein